LKNIDVMVDSTGIHPKFLKADLLIAPEAL